MTPVEPGTQLSALFGDHVVLQQGRPIPVWGWDEPGQSVRVELWDVGAAGRRSLSGAGSAQAGADGRFRIDLPSLSAGGPYELCAEGSRRVLSRDVWIGEVWLASGQSNMEWKVAAAADASREIQAAAWPAIRLFEVEDCAAEQPVRDARGAWRICSPDSVAEFSAVGYAFARELHQSLGVAVGIIDASWGGTGIAAWTSLPALRPVLPDLEAQMAALARQQADLPAVARAYEQALLGWQREHLPTDPGNRGLAAGWASPDWDDSDWPSLSLPAFWQSHGMAFNGVVWFRREVHIPASFAGRALSLSLGAIDDFDDTYFEGELVGATPPGTPSAHQQRRRYTLPAARVTSGRALIAVRVFDQCGSGGFAGPGVEMFLEPVGSPAERIALSGAWKLRVEREIPLVPMSVFHFYPQPPVALALQHAPAALFHGMIAPLVPYALRGAIWYQGENDTARHALYRALQVALIRDWRTRWGQGQFPFFYVQLASFVAGGEWPWFREAQASARTEPETGMVVSLDIGDPQDIHPRNKREVGRRLALLARARTYGDAALLAEGPQLSGMTITGASVQLRFAHAAGLRTTDGGAPRGFELAGPSGDYAPARARLVGEEVWLEPEPGRTPSAVRYAWADNPDANLENGAGLPAAPFRTDSFG